MDDSIFDEFDGSSDFEPAAKPKPKITKKPVATKAAPKKTAQATSKPSAKLKVSTTKKRQRPDSDQEDDVSESAQTFDDESLLSNTPPKAKKPKSDTTTKANRKSLGDVVNEAMALDGASDTKSKKKRISEQYQKLTPIEHILKRPDTYIGSVERTEKQMWVYNTVQDSMEFREVSFVPGLYKIFDEVLVNAADNKQNDKNMDEIRVNIDSEKGEISVWNNGKGIPIEIHSKEQVYVPEMIFGHLLTSSNYDDDQQKVTGGRNGYGAKLANIYSTEFTVETADSKKKKKYTQTWADNMSKMGKARIVDYKNDDFTKVTFRPDFSKFKMSGMDDDFEALVKRRVYDLAGTCKGVSVKLNGSRLPLRSFKKYMEMYTKAIKKERGEEAANDTSDIITDSPDPRWEIGFAVSDGSFQQVSFVNSIATTSGGTHVNYIADQICNKLGDIVKKKNKGGVALKINQIRNHIFIFVNSLIVNPAFTSQTKEQLTTKSSQFGSKCNVSDDFLKKIARTEVVNNILHFAQQKADQVLKKSDGSKRSRMNNPKLIDANKAGTKDGHLCTLILTEGDSAKGLAIAGRAVVGPDLFGVFPLRGKLLNVRDATVDQISKNAEIQNIKNFLGLQHKKVYTDTKGLRYGHVMIMTDQDHDGSHIKGLLINFLQVTFPSLLKIPEFLVEFITPIIKVWKGDPKNPSQSRVFFTMPEYETWKEAHKHQRGWDHKYYKGLGTSSTDDAQQYFNDLDKHHKEFHTMKEEEEQLIDLAFSKKKADERKDWLRQFKPGTFLDHSAKKISYTDFINKELILFSMADNIRSIPSVVDGLKPGQRKVLFTCFKRNVKKDIKVVELAGHVSGLTAYQHGESSLQQTIVGLAQTFVGSNNVNCLEPSGNFGSRLMGGGDAASARYIYTRLSPFARKLFHTADEPLLTYNTDDEKRIEPETYMPVVPMILINGADGIGTGWSSQIPNYNPEDIVANLKLMMAGEAIVPMKPWFRGFKGEAALTGPDRYKFSGIIKETQGTEIEITELPIRTWTQDFKDKLEEIIKGDKGSSFIKDYKDYNTHKDVHFVIQIEKEQFERVRREGFEETFKLSKSIATSNLVAFDPEGRITKYATVEDILKEFYAVRIKFYEKRKQWLLADMQKDLDKLSNQARFVQMIIDHKLNISKKKKAVLISELKKLNFTPFAKVEDATKDGELQAVVQDEPESEEEEVLGANVYDYLLGMPLWSLTQERVEKLLRQVGEKEIEIDMLIKLSKEDLWKRDLEDFIEEWRFQLDDERKRQRAIVQGRRESKKFKVPAKNPTKKRKGYDEDLDDSEFDLHKPKKAATASKITQSKITTLAPKPRIDWLTQSRRTSTDGASDLIEELNDDVSSKRPEKKQAMKPEEGGTKTAKLAEESKPVVIVKTSNTREVQAEKPKSRQARAVAKKPVKYVSSSELDSDNGDDLLGDVSKMVKGLPNTGVESKQFFSTSISRPGSSSGYQIQSKPTIKPAVESEDETDYVNLIPQQSPRRSILVTAKESTMTDDEDDVSIRASTVPAKTVSKRVPAAKATKTDGTTTKATSRAAKGTKAKANAPPKKTVQSPVAKAYAKRLAKKRVIDSDDEMEALADDMLQSPGSSRDDEGGALVNSKSAAARPSRRAAATTKKSTYVFDDDESSEDVDESSSGEPTEDEADSGFLSD